MQISQSIDFFPTIHFTQLLSGSSSMKYINLVTPLAFTAEKLAIEESGFLVHCMFNVDTLSRWRHAHFEISQILAPKSTHQNFSKISQIITNKCISLHKKFGELLLSSFSELALTLSFAHLVCDVNIETM